MKNTNLKLNKTKLLARLMLVIFLLTSTLTLASCGNRGLEAGFYYTSIGNDDAPYPMFRCAYKSDKTEFDINDVSLMFYYGGLYSLYLQEEERSGISYPVYELYFSNNWADLKKIFIKQVEDELISEKYRFTTKKFFCYNFCEFNYSVELTIPKELFENEEGVIWFSIYSRNIHNDDEIFETIDVYYKKDGDKIILSTKGFS